MSIKIVPPIQGDIAKANLAIDRLNSVDSSADFLFMGDYYLGPQGKEVISLLHTDDFKDASFLMGNEDKAFIQYLRSRSNYDIVNLLDYGVESFFKQFVEYQKLENISPFSSLLVASPDIWRDFNDCLLEYFTDNFRLLGGLNAYYKNDDLQLICTHTGMTRIGLQNMNVPTYNSDNFQCFLRIYLAGVRLTVGALHDHLAKSGLLGVSFSDRVMKFNKVVNRCVAAVNHKTMICCDPSLSEMTFAPNFLERKASYIGIPHGITNDFVGLVVNSDEIIVVAKESEKVILRK